MKRSPVKISGFTLVELVAATGLAALLMVAAVQVLRNLGPPGAGPGDRGRASVVRAADLLRWDLSQAVQMREDGDGLRLVGFGAIDPATRVPTHRPVAVRYVLRPAGDARWLVREQHGLDGGDDLNWIEPIAADALALRLTPIGPEQASNTAAGGAAVFAGLYDMSPVPRSLRLELVTRETRLDQTLYTR